MNKVSIIIPCYNEEGTIRECLRQIPVLESETEILVVDDGSTDRTAEYVREADRPNTKIIRHEHNLGKGAAVSTGLQHAAGDIVVILDADYTVPPSEIPAAIKPIVEGKADFVNGSRFTYPMEGNAMKRLHRFTNKVTACIFSIFLGQRITDSLCGLKAFRKEMLAGKLKEKGWPDFELLVQAKKNNMRIVEVPFHYRTRKAGISKMKTLRESYRMPILLIRSLMG